MPPLPTRRGLLAGGVATLAAPALGAEPCVPDENTRRRLEDFPNLARYADENAALLASRQAVHIVFMGDSITEGWLKGSPAFWRAGRVDRGIGGQTTPQMVLRMMQDVVALRPRACHIMAGTNDIAGNTGPITAHQTLDNIAAMAALARDVGITVLLGAIPPAARFGWRPEVDAAGEIRARNARLRSYAKQHGIAYIDYHAALTTPGGGMRPGLAGDGVHPTPEGYAVMERVVTPYLARFER